MWASRITCLPRHVVASRHSGMEHIGSILSVSMLQCPPWIFRDRGVYASIHGMDNYNR